MHLHSEYTCWIQYIIGLYFKSQNSHIPLHFVPSCWKDCCPSADSDITGTFLFRRLVLDCFPLTCRHLSNKTRMGSYHLHSQDLLLLLDPTVCTELEKRTFKYATPSVWNQLQNRLHVRELISLDSFKVILNDLELASSGCSGFENSLIYMFCNFCTYFIVFFLFLFFFFRFYHFRLYCTCPCLKLCCMSCCLSWSGHSWKRG